MSGRAPAGAMSAACTPVTILTGALGAGKTTLAAAVLARDPARRVGLIINEIGEVGIDGQLLSPGSEQLIELASGCLCCSVRGELEIALTKMALAGVDQILIETTGVADPGPVIDAVTSRPDLLRLDSVVCVVDARSIAGQLADRRYPQIQRQIELASTVIISKPDLAGNARLAGARTQVSRLSPSAEVLEAVAGDVPPAKVFNVFAFAPGRVTRDEASPKPRRRFRTGIGSPHPQVETIAVRCDQELDLQTTMQWLQGLTAFKGPDLNRLKGILAIEGLPHAVVIHGVHGYLESAPGRPWAEAEERRSTLVAIGHELDEQLWQAALGDCAAVPR